LHGIVRQLYILLHALGEAVVTHYGYVF